MRSGQSPHSACSPGLVGEGGLEATAQAWIHSAVPQAWTGTALYVGYIVRAEAGGTWRREATRRDTSCVKPDLDPISLRTPDRVEWDPHVVSDSAQHLSSRRAGLRPGHDRVLAPRGLRGLRLPPRHLRSGLPHRRVLGLLPDLRPSGRALRRWLV